ncbi:hypothetical protein MPH_14230, partial [Macrophomina phaseolina MS6]
ILNGAMLWQKNSMLYSRIRHGHLFLHRQIAILLVASGCI